MKYTCALLAGILLGTSTALSQEAAGSAAPTAQPALTPPGESIDSLCSELVSVSQQVYNLLGEVADKESADRVAPRLKEKLHFMSDRLRLLETLPFDHEQDTEALKSHMASLTHISQSNLAAMQRLAEVNAYGSEDLMAIFDRYKVEKRAINGLDADDLPQTQLYNELADTLESAIFTLQQIQSEEQAKAGLESLRPLLHKLEAAHNKLTILAPPHTDEQREALRPARERLARLSDELKKEISRLQAAKYYNCLELDTQLPRLLRLAAG